MHVGSMKFFHTLDKITRLTPTMGNHCGRASGLLRQAASISLLLSLEGQADLEQNDGRNHVPSMADKS